MATINVAMAVLKVIATMIYRLARGLLPIAVIPLLAIRPNVKKPKIIEITNTRTAIMYLISRHVSWADVGGIDFIVPIVELMSWSFW